MTNTLRAVLLALPMSMLMIQSPLRADDESSDDMYENDSLEHVQVTATRTSKRDIDISAAVTAIDEKAIRELRKIIEEADIDEDLDRITTVNKRSFSLEELRELRKAVKPKDEN